MELPLLLVCKEFDDDEEDEHAGKDEVGDAERAAFGKAGEDNEDVRRGSDQVEQNRLHEGDEEDIEEEPDKAAGYASANDFPTVVF